MKTIIALALCCGTLSAQFISQSTTGLKVIGLETPAAPTITNVGTTGATTYTYLIVAKTAAGAQSIKSATASTTTGNATLSATNYNVISWVGVQNAASYDVYRTVGGGTTGKIATSVAVRTLNDTGLTGDGSTAPTTNASGSFTVPGPMSGGSMATGAISATTGDFSGAVTIGTTVGTTAQQIDVVCSGNITTALQAAITALGNANGGTVRLSSGSCYSTDKITFVNDGNSLPKQRAIRITGQNSSPSGIDSVPYGGTILDLQYDGTIAKIDTRGGGLLEIDHLTLKDSTSSTLPFLQTTNTTLYFHHNTVIGTGTSQDVLILGGVDTGAANGGPTSPFQGYGTVIESNYFAKVQRGVYLKTYANAVVIQNNTWWNTCGGAAAIESLGHSTNSNSGGVISGNLIEMPTYTYGIKMAYSSNWTIVGNNFYDPGVGVTAFVRLESTAVYNTVIDGFHSDLYTGLSDASGTNTHITGHQDQPSIAAAPWRFKSTLTVDNNGAGPAILDASSNTYTQQMFSGTDLQWNYKASAGSSEDVLKISRASSTDKRLILLGSSNNVITSTAGNMRIWSATGEALWLGDSSNQMYILSKKLKLNGGTISGLPTSCSGLATNDLWNDSGTVKVCP